MLELVSDLVDLISDWLEFISEIPKPVIIFFALLAIGLIILIIKKALKLAIIIISILVLLFVLFNFAGDYLPFYF